MAGFELISGKQRKFGENIEGRKKCAGSSGFGERNLRDKTIQ
jgi:hypothetical protein